MTPEQRLCGARTHVGGCRRNTASPVPLTLFPALAPKPRNWCYFCLQLGGLNGEMFVCFFKFQAMQEKHLELWRTLEIVFFTEQELPISFVTSRVLSLNSSSASSFLFIFLFFFVFSLTLLPLIVWRPGWFPGALQMLRMMYR